MSRRFPSVPRDRVTLRPVGRGGWRPLVVEIVSYPRAQGRLFRQDDSQLELVDRGDVWVVNGRELRVSKVERGRR